MPLRIPVEQNSAGFKIELTLEGDIFKLEFRYNDRDERYYLNVRDENDELIASSIKIVRGVPLLRNISNPKRPKGEFYVYDIGANAEPTIDNLGDGIDIVFISYFEAI